MQDLQGSDASSVEGVRFRNTQRAAVEFGLTTRGQLDRQTGGLQCVGQRPARGVHCCGIAQRCFRVSQDFGQAFFVFGQEVFDAVRGFFLVAALASQRQVGDSVAAALRLGPDVFDLQRHVFGIAVGALAMPFLQQVLAQLVAEQGALLVFHARDFRVLQRLHVKAHQFAAERGDGRPALDALHPGHAGIDPVLQ